MYGRRKLPTPKAVVSYDDFMTELIEKLINLFIAISLLLKPFFISSLLRNT